LFQNHELIIDVLSIVNTL